MTAGPPTDLDRVRLTRLTTPAPMREQLAADVRRGLSGPHKELPPIYFYDARGSQLFERITELEEYYPTRAETEILTRVASEVVAAARVAEVVELGSGSSVKTDLLLAALHEQGTGDVYVPLDISEDALLDAARRLTARHPWLHVDAYVADFTRDLGHLPARSPRLLAFLGSTIGNLLRGQRQVLLREIAGALEADDVFLVGADLVKDVVSLVAAYDDAEGVTAEFNRNVLHVVNRGLDADIPVDAFDHRAHWDATHEEIQLHLVARRDVRATVRALGVEVRLAEGEHVVTERSCKFRIDGLRKELLQAGLRVEEVHTDARDRFALLQARRAR